MHKRACHFDMNTESKEKAFVVHVKVIRPLFLFYFVYIYSYICCRCENSVVFCRKPCKHACVAVFLLLVIANK